MGGFFGDWEFNDLVSPPRTPNPTASVRSTVSESSTPVLVRINNHDVYVPKRLKADACNAARRIGSNWVNALSLKKELILNPDILIPLLNQAKLYWHDWLAKQPEDVSASERIENAFVNNENLSKEESDWVRQTIMDYKNTVEMATDQNTPRPITPPPSIVSLPPVGECSGTTL